MEKIIRNPVVSCRIEDDSGAILFNPDTDTVQVINEPGLLIWQELAKPCSCDEVVQFIASQYESELIDQIRADVEEFLEKMKQNDFVCKD